MQKFNLSPTKSIILLLFTAFFGLFFFAPRLLQGLADYLVINHPLKKADVIVVLGGEKGERVLHAARLYYQGWADKIIMCGGQIAWQTNCAEVMRKQARHAGVLAKDILLEKKSRSTYEDAKFVLPMLRKNKFKKIILVTSPYHSRRAYKTFYKLLKPAGIKVLMSPVKPNKYTVYNPKRWWLRHEDGQIVLFAYIKLCLYFMKGYL